MHFNFFPAIGDFCRQLIIFANRLDPDQARQNVEKVNFNKKKKKKKSTYEQKKKKKKKKKLTQHAKS